MKFDFKGNPNQNISIEDLIQLIRNTSDKQKWIYQGLDVTIDPTVDYTNQNVLIRWLDTTDGFNDKIIIYSLLEFNAFFKPKSIC